MADQTKPSWFRRPWLSSSFSVRQLGESSASQTSTNAPKRQPSSRVPRTASTKRPSTQTRKQSPSTTPEKAEPRENALQELSSQAKTQTGDISPRTSPSRTTQTQGSSLPPPSSLGKHQPQDPSFPPSPSRGASISPPKSQVGAMNESGDNAPVELPPKTQTQDDSPKISLSQANQTQGSSSAPPSSLGGGLSQDFSVPPSPSPSHKASKSPPAYQPPAMTELRYNAQLELPSQEKTQTLGNSPKMSPPRTPRIQGSLPSPSSLGKPLLQDSSIPPSPSHKASESLPALQSQSSSHLDLEPSSKDLQPIAQESTQLTQDTSNSELEKEKLTASKPLSQEHQLENEIQPKTSPGSQEHIQMKPSSQNEKVAAQLKVQGEVAEPKPVSAPETLATTIKPDFVTTNEGSTTPSKETREIQTTKEKKEMVQGPVKGEKAESLSYEHPTQRRTELVSAASTSGTQIKDQIRSVFQAEKKQQNVHKTFEGKTSYMYNPDKEDIKIVSSINPEKRNISSISHQKPAPSNGKEQAHPRKEIRENISKLVHKLATGDPTQNIDKPITVITLAGDNKGATMHITSESAKKERLLHIHRGYKTNPEESPDFTTDGERSFRKSSQDSTKEDALTRAYVNSNIQGANNSLIFNSSVTERKPGVQLILPRPQVETRKTKADDTAAVLGTHKSEFNITPAEKLTYEPTIRRRCLRGLLLESSDSDPENPQKPLRHGCRYGCALKSKEKDIGIL